MRKYTYLASVLALAFSAHAAWAQQFTPPTFEGLDTNKDGKLSTEEVGAFAANIPAGPNGAVSADMIMSRWDADKDGVVTREEFDNRPRRGGGPGGPGGQPPGN